MSSAHADGGTRLEWPEGYDRTDSNDREPYPGNLSVGHKQAFESIVEELERWGKTGVDIRTAGTHYANDANIPHKSADPDDVGVVAYYRDLESHSSERSAIACDRWETHVENARAIALWVRRVRLADRCGVATARDIDEVAQLPPADEEAIAAPAPPTDDGLDEAPHEVLGVAPDAPDAVVRGAFRELVKEGHADVGGRDDLDVDAIRKARDQLLGAGDE